MSDSHTPVHTVNADIDSIRANPVGSPTQRHHAYATLAPTVRLQIIIMKVQQLKVIEETNIHIEMTRP